MDIETWMAPGQQHGDEVLSDFAFESGQVKMQNPAVCCAMEGGTATYRREHSDRLLELQIRFWTEMIFKKFERSISV